MKIAIMQPYFFPYLGYIQLVNKFVFCDDVNFIKNCWIARNRIISRKNSSQYFGIELVRSSQNKLINEIRICNCAIKKLKTIKHIYSKAPFFNDVYPLLEECLINPVPTIAEMAANSVVMVADYLGIETEFEFSSKMYANSKSLSRSERIISICRQEKCL
ncbi:WbqC family protein [Ancylomarina sp.]|uniref:WbqC family protein n=1 Tax=Ancylomarina sp. TaxID=1970196 RepID=UPI003568CB3C